MIKRIDLKIFDLQISIKQSQTSKYGIVKIFVYKRSTALKDVQNVLIFFLNSFRLWNSEGHLLISLRNLILHEDEVICVSSTQIIISKENYSINMTSYCMVLEIALFL